MNRHLEALAGQMRVLANFGGSDAMARQLHDAADALIEAYRCGVEAERDSAIAYFQRIAQETEDQSRNGKAHWANSAASALRNEWHVK